MEAGLEQATRRAIAEHGVEALVVDDLRPAELPLVAWAGGPGHARRVALALERAAAGEVDYLAVRAPDGRPVSIGGVDFAAHEGAGMLWQLATFEPLRGLGLGTRLIAELERRILRRGRSRAVLGVEDGNDRALALYRRLGYEPYTREEATWPGQDERGHTIVHRTWLTMLGKTLALEEATGGR